MPHSLATTTMAPGLPVEREIDTRCARIDFPGHGLRAMPSRVVGDGGRVLRRGVLHRVEGRR